MPLRGESEQVHDATNEGGATPRLTSGRWTPRPLFSLWLIIWTTVFLLSGESPAPPMTCHPHSEEASQAPTLFSRKWPQDPAFPLGLPFPCTALGSQAPISGKFLSLGVNDSHAKRCRSNRPEGAGGPARSLCELGNEGPRRPGGRLATQWGPLAPAQMRPRDLTPHTARPFSPQCHITPSKLTLQGMSRLSSLDFPLKRC